VGYFKFFMYSGHGEFHEYNNFMKVMLVVYFEPSLQKLVTSKHGFWVKAVSVIGTVHV
jgi:hypothetical protein